MERQEKVPATQAGKTAPGDTEYEFLLPFPQPMTRPRMAVPSDEWIYLANVESGMDVSTLFVARTARNGDVDTSFGRGGWIAEFVEIRFGEPIGLWVREGGGVLAAVKDSVDSRLEVALICFTEAGELDSTFGDGGKIIHRIEVPGSSSESTSSKAASDVAEHGQAAGSGTAFAATGDGTFYCLLGTGNGPFYALMRLQSDGTLDTRFNGTGYVTDGEWAYRQWGATSIVVGSDARVTVLGEFYDVTAVPDRRLVAWRFDQDGSIDRSFGDDGYAFFDADAADVAPENLYQMSFDHAASLPDGGVAVCGALTTVSGTTYQRFGLLACLDASGKPLDTFNRGKFLLYGVMGEYGTDFRGGIAVQGDGKIVVGGGVSESLVTDSELLVARFQPSGSRDLTFGDGGARRFKGKGAQVNYMRHLLIDSKGNILVAAIGGPNNSGSSMWPFVFQLTGGQ
ncbi:delta-60 repeat domain-containing protein [Luteibacter sp. UNCMF366Tsu5.1]|nr:delta-60 repeat domain-containing protein [Luteibacter sp. UNCMF366Tsu5.1]